MTMQRIPIMLLALLCTLAVSAQDIRSYPAHWWTGMRHHSVKLLVRSADGTPFAPSARATSSTPGIVVRKVKALRNPHYLQVSLDIAPNARPGKHLLTVGGHRLPFELRAKDPGDGRTRIRGVDSRDLTYLLMPDRFANGDPANDAFPGLRDPAADRTNKFARHGGDLKGVEDRLDYFSRLGVTTLWFTPVTENDMPRMREGNWDMAGYHGYWFTDHYAVDRRLGGNTAYRSLVDKAHAKGLKIIQDAIYNHIGLHHWIQTDPPDSSWVNQWPSFTGPNHREETLMDPYASRHDKDNMLNGWFTPHLPDLNLANPDLADYLIQHAIWSVEEFGFDGFRIDTYKYCDEAFLNRMNAELLREFPTLTTFVEAWANTTVANAYYVRNNFQIPFKHNAPGAIDFSLCFAMQAAMTQSPGWTEGVNRIYMTLAQDFIYQDPMKNCIFLDNHDMDRIFSVVGQDWNRFTWGINWLLTLRGIPQLYYGTEILMKNFKNPTDAEVRLDFPGGWPGDAVDKFTEQGRNPAEQQAFTHISTLANFRKASSALTTGRTMQYVVRNGAYVYFRYDARQTVMVVTNTGKEAFRPDWGKEYAERTAGFTRARNVVTGAETPLASLVVPPGAGWVLELK
jgi:glycosidase